MVRLEHKLRNERIAKGLEIHAAPREGPSADSREPTSTRKKTRAAKESPPWERRSVYMPAFLVATTLPHSDPATSEYRRVNGKTVTSLLSPRHKGIPYGVYARLILIDLTTLAVRTRRRKVIVGRSMREFLSRMGISKSGGAGGQLTLATEQLDRLCATTFKTTHLSKFGGISLDTADQWMEKTDSGLTVTLSERFFEQATKSAVPLDPIILRKVRRSPLSIDIYGWITYRMATLEEPVSISWPSLEKQFGSEYKHPRQFRWKFGQCLDRVKNAWPAELRVAISEKSVRLDPGPPSVSSRSERHNAKHGQELQFAPVR